MDLDANEISGLILITILTGIIISIIAVGFWQSFHCAMCNRWLPWETVKNGNYCCEDRGPCNLERLALKYK
jgi:hypothetical protein